jgi:glycosyltransferase involved in cell wall biosynthesis
MNAFENPPVPSLVNCARTRSVLSSFLVTRQAKSAASGWLPHGIGLRVDRCPRDLYKTATPRLRDAGIRESFLLLDTENNAAAVGRGFLYERGELDRRAERSLSGQIMARYFLADPSLISFSGHCYEYLASLVAPLKRSGHQVVLLGNVAVDAVLRDERSVAPCFQFWCDTRLETPERTRQAHEQAIRDDLLAMTRDFLVSDRDVVVINTLRHWAMRGVVDWLEALPVRRRPRTALILHFTAFPDQNKSEGWECFYHDAFHRIETSACRDKIVLMADSEQLVSEYSRINPSLHFHLAPIPHAKVYGNDGDTLARIKTGEKLRIGYVGEARTNKGFDFLPRLLVRATALELSDLIELHIHAYCGNPSAPFYRQTLCGLRHPAATLYFHPMDDVEYSDFLAQLDVITLPYTTDNYHSQTSGVFAEAMASGKIVVVPKGTWLSAQLQRYGGGESFNPLDCEDFAVKTLHIVREPLRYARMAAERASLWRDFHNPDRLINCLEASSPESTKAVQVAV